MAIIDKDTEAELRRLATAPGHDRMGMMAKGCIVGLLDELVELRAFYDGANATVIEPPTSILTVSEKATVDKKKKPFVKRDTVVISEESSENHDPELSAEISESSDGNVYNATLTSKEIKFTAGLYTDSKSNILDEMKGTQVSSYNSKKDIEKDK